MDTGWVLGHQCFWEPTGVTQQPGDLAGWWAQDLAPRLSPVLEARSWTPAGRCPPCVALNQLGPHRVPRTGLGQGQAHRLHPLQQPHTASPLPPPPAGAAIAAQEDGRPLWPLERPPVPVSAQQGGCPAPPAMGRQEPCCGAQWPWDCWTHRHPSVRPGAKLKTAPTSTAPTALPDPVGKASTVSSRSPPKPSSPPRAHP